MVREVLSKHIEMADWDFHGRLGAWKRSSRRTLEEERKGVYILVLRVDRVHFFEIFSTSRY